MLRVSQPDSTLSYFSYIEHCPYSIHILSSTVFGGHVFNESTVMILYSIHLCVLKASSSAKLKWHWSRVKCLSTRMHLTLEDWAPKTLLIWCFICCKVIFPWSIFYWSLQNYYYRSANPFFNPNSLFVAWRWHWRAPIII